MELDGSSKHNNTSNNLTVLVGICNLPSRIYNLDCKSVKKTYHKYLIAHDKLVSTSVNQYNYIDTCTVGSFYKLYSNIGFDPNVIYFIRKRIYILRNFGSTLQKYHPPSSSSVSFPFLATFFTAAIHVKLSLAKYICFIRMAIVSDLEPLRGFQAQNMVYVFIQTSSYAKSIVHLKSFLVFKPKYVLRTC